jgi:hypothetical protein
MYSIKIEAGNEIKYTIKNANMIELYTNTIEVPEEINTETGEIKGITIGNKTIKVGDKFSHGYEEIPSSYEVSKIMKGGDPKVSFRHKYTILSHERVKTTDYILPCLGQTKGYFDVEGYLVNAYLGKKDNKLYLLYRFAKTKFYDDLEKRLLNHPRLVKIDNSIPGYDVFVYSIPEQHLEDIELFKKGKYSKLSDALKTKIKVFYGLNVKSNLWKILTKDESLIKELENAFRTPKGFFWNIDLDVRPKIEKEIWNY